MQKTLANHLKRAGGHLGRTNPELQRIAALSGLSIHHVQSLAMGRRGFSTDSRARIRKALGKV